MDRELCVGRQRIRFNREATLALYRDLIPGPDPYICDCAGCRNFAAQRHKAYPEEFLRLLAELGVDPGKEWEAFDYDLGTVNPPNHLYGGWFVFSGEIIEGIYEYPAEDHPVFTYWFTTSFPAPTFPTDLKVCAVEFITSLPWVIPEIPS